MNIRDIGNISAPYYLNMALSSSKIQPGHTLYLRGGVYSGDYVSALTGAQGNPITIKAYPGERPIIDGSMQINGNDTTWEGITFTYSGWATRLSAQTGSAPTDIPITKTIGINGPRTTMRRCVFHDLAIPGFWAPAVDGMLEECLSYNNGWDAPDRGHGHGMYTQNATGTKTIKRCVFAPGYSNYSIHAYAESNALQGFDIIECVSIGQVMLAGGLVPVDRATFTRNMVWGGGLRTGFGANVQNGSAVLTDNILANGAQRVTSGTWQSLIETGTDTTTGNHVFTYGNLVVVFNRAGAASVAAPLAGTYINCQNPAESIALAQGAALPMSGWTVATPTAGAGPLAASTFPTFGCFLVTP